MKWILQDRNFALGNFVNVTPIIKYLFQETGNPVPVHFETQYVREAYEGCHMIEILEQRPEGGPFASSSMICKANDMPDYVYAFQLATGKSYGTRYRPIAPKMKTAVLICGSGSERPEYVDSKTPGFNTYKHAVHRLIQAGYSVSFVGSLEDMKRTGNLSAICNGWNVIGDIRKAIEKIRLADVVIANDTGLAHVAGTFDKNMLVLWKDTPAVRCKNSGLQTIYSYGPENWIADIESFINTYAK